MKAQWLSDSRSGAGHVEAMHVLLAAGADVTQRDDFNQSCIRRCAHKSTASGGHVLPAARDLRIILG